MNKTKTSAFLILLLCSLARRVPYLLLGAGIFLCSLLPAGPAATPGDVDSANMLFRALGVFVVAYHVAGAAWRALRLYLGATR